ncbi:hypothetical protein FWD07_03135 [Candidatus Saccharibacteria bacterium]|nr:hypothetical protein [Candidatus Saccharibacteria bacterium]
MVLASGQLVNYRGDSKGNCVMSPYEADVVAAILSAELHHDNGQKGTFHMTTKVGKTERVHLTFDLPGGINEDVVSSRWSCTVAISSLKTRKDLKSGIYCVSGAKVLVLKNAKGIIFAAISGDFGYSPDDDERDMSFLLTVAAETLLYMREDDVILQAAVEEVDLPDRHHVQSDVVGFYFSDRVLPEIIIWLKQKDAPR